MLASKSTSNNYNFGSAENWNACEITCAKHKETCNDGEVKVYDSIISLDEESL